MGNSLPARYYTLQAGKKIIIVALMINKLFLQEHEYGIKKGKENIKNGNKCLAKAFPRQPRYPDATANRPKHFLTESPPRLTI